MWAEVSPKDPEGDGRNGNCGASGEVACSLRCIVKEVGQGATQKSNCAHTNDDAAHKD